MKMINILRLVYANIQMLFINLSLPGVHFHPMLFKKWLAELETKRRKTVYPEKTRLQERSLVRASGTVTLGEGSEIDANSEVIASGSGNIRIGSHVFLNRNCILVSCGDIEIGEGTAIGCNVTILDHDHNYVAQAPRPWNEIKAGSVRIGKHVWIGANSVILSGSVIGDNAVIAAGSIVKGIVPASTLFVQKKTQN